MVSEIDVTKKLWGESIRSSLVPSRDLFLSEK